jgi:WD40 repeat protein
MAIDVRNLSSRVVADLTGKLPWPKAVRAWSKSEGSPSRDGRYWAFQVETENFEILGFATWDMVQGKLVGTVPVQSRPDHVSMSPSGRWFVSSGADGTVAWAPDFSRKKVLHKKTEHSDLGIGANGHDYYVSIDYQSNEGYVFMVDIETGERTDLIRTYINGAATAMHFSGKAYDKPGWFLLSTYNPGGPSQWYMDKVFAIELKANPRVYQLAAHHSTVKDAYFAEPQATVNRDFTRVLFNSNWGVPASNDVDAYMVLLNPGCFP